MVDRKERLTHPAHYIAYFIVNRMIEPQLNAASTSKRAAPNEEERGLHRQQARTTFTMVHVMQCH